MQCRCFRAGSWKFTGIPIQEQADYDQFEAGTRMEYPTDFGTGTVVEVFSRAYANPYQVVCIAQSAVTADQVAYGLGYPVEMLTSSDVTTFLKVRDPDLAIHISH